MNRIVRRRDTFSGSHYADHVREQETFQFPTELPQCLKFRGIQDGPIRCWMRSVRSVAGGICDGRQCPRRFDPSGVIDKERLLRAQIALSLTLGLVLARSSTGLEPLTSATEAELHDPLSIILTQLLSAPPFASHSPHESDGPDAR